MRIAGYAQERLPYKPIVDRDPEAFLDGLFYTPAESDGAVGAIDICDTRRHNIAFMIGYSLGMMLAMKNELVETPEEVEHV